MAGNKKKKFVEKGMRMYDMQPEDSKVKTRMSALAHKAGKPNASRGLAQASLGTAYDMKEGAKTAVNKVKNAVKPVKSKRVKKILKDYKKREKK